MLILGWMAACGGPGLGSNPTSGPSTPPPATSTPSATTVSFDTCEDDYGYDSGLAASVWAEVDEDGRIVAHLDHEFATCCPEPGATFEVADPGLALDFDSNTSTIECDCVCRFSFVATSAPYPSGDYDLAVVYDGEDQGTVQVHVP